MKSLDRIGVIRQSLAIFIYGLAGLAPILGLLPAILALLRGSRLRHAYPGPNPADRYRKWGMVLGICGILISLYTVIFIVAQILENLQHGDAFMD